jgi:DNA-directed RNA polymerase subunit N (RpoN/RPB10)
MGIPGRYLNAAAAAPAPAKNCPALVSCCHVAKSPALKMIIPVRCFECGKVLADKWRYYQRKVKDLKGESAPDRVYFDGGQVPATAEKKVLDALQLNQCCRTHFLTQVDLIDKI